MKYIYFSILWGLLALLLGLVLILWPEIAVTYLVIAIGILFIIPGVISIISYFVRKGQKNSLKRRFPVEAAGSILFGIWMIAQPAFFVNIFMYVMGALLLIASIQQLTLLVRARKLASVGWGFYVVPVLLLITGVLILIYPFEAATNTFVVFGIACAVYGISFIVNAICFRKSTKELETKIDEIRAETPPDVF